MEDKYIALRKKKDTHIPFTVERKKENVKEKDYTISTVQQDQPLALWR